MENLRNTRLHFTLEEQLVATVWYHERFYTGMTYDQLANNFMIRFKNRYPNYTTLKLWEKKLFKHGRVTGQSLPKRKISLARLMYVPYVKESFLKYPDLTLKQRTEMLGIAFTTLKEILKHDLTPSDLALSSPKKIQESSQDTTNEKNIEESCSKDNNEEKGKSQTNNEDSSNLRVSFGEVTIKSEEIEIEEHN